MKGSFISENYDNRADLGKETLKVNSSMNKSSDLISFISSSIIKNLRDRQNDKETISKSKLRETCYQELIKGWSRLIPQSSKLLSDQLHSTQLFIELEEGLDFYFNDRKMKLSTDEINEFVQNWEIRLPSKKRDLGKSSEIFKNRNLMFCSLLGCFQPKNNENDNLGQIFNESNLSGNFIICLKCDCVIT